jgi:hypothetical protein
MSRSTTSGPSFSAIVARLRARIARTEAFEVEVEAGIAATSGAGSSRSAVESGGPELIGPMG